MKLSFLVCVCVCVACVQRDARPGTTLTHDSGRAFPGGSSAAVFGWIGLYTSDIVEWLENENRIGELCPDARPAAERERCRSEQLATRTLEIVVRDAPSPDAGIAGVIVVRATPGRPLAFSLRTDGATRDFVPDLFLDDWGYGPYAHVTATETRGAWIRLPVDPFPASAWVDASRLDSGTTLLLVGEGDIVASSFGDLVVTSVDSTGLVVRAEQPADMWCQDAPAPPRAAAPARTLAREQLFDATGRLVLALKYLKGC